MNRVIRPRDRGGACLLPLLLTLSAGCDPAPSPGSPAQPGPTAPGSSSSSAPGQDSRTLAAGGFVTGVGITKISLYQAVEVPLMRDGAEVTTPNAPVVAKRPGLVRVFVRPAAGWRPRSVVARFALGGTSTQTLDATLNLATSSTEDDLTSTLNIDLPAGALLPGATYSVSLLEAREGLGEQTGARYPASATSSLRVQDGNGPLRIRIVPVAAGGFLPDTRPENLRALHDAFMKRYPVAEVIVDVRAPITFAGSLFEYPHLPNKMSADGQWDNTGYDAAADFDANGGLSGIFQLVQSTRDADHAGPDIQYLGVAAPGPSHARFSESYARGGQSFGPGGYGSKGGCAAIVGLFPGGDDYPEASELSAVHEIGHVFGLLHTGYGTSADNSVDPSYPYADGGIGVEGYDLLARTLIPTTKKDMMGYGGADWISDYHFARLFTAILETHRGP